MSENDSFIDEVTEEVRRDKLYLFLKRYGWIPGTLIILIILGSIFVEVRSNSAQTAAEELGAFLSSSLTEDASFDENIVDQLETFKVSKPLVSLLLKAKILENNSNYRDTIRAYETILDIDGIPKSISDFVKFKLLLLINDDPTRVEKLLADLINPDSAFNLLALEQMVIKNIADKNWKEASSNLDLLIANPESSQALISRATQIKKALKLDSL